MLRRKPKSVTQKVGQIPGSLQYTGVKKEEKPGIRLLQYDENEVVLNKELAYKDILKNLQSQKVNWIHFFTLDQVEAVEKIGEHFNIHSLMLEDTLNVEHLPKVEFSEDHVFLTLKILSLDNQNQLEQEHASFILGDDYLISFKEQRGELLKPIRLRIENNVGKVRKKRADYLFYLLVDAIVDNYFVLIEKLRTLLEDLEDALIENPSENYIYEIHHIKKQILTIRKYIVALRESIFNLINEEPRQIFESNYKYLRDVQDHVNFVFDAIETFREDQKTLMELNMSNMSNRMNQVMKTLTVVASIFIPLTFIAGIYGMNFKNMPELDYQYGYFIVWGIMLVLTALMVWYMKRKKWF